jgi:hypothetical protein|tara:strand:+ start:7939 stop:8196 length:258 start_codon:yes stop_codon:yes gene_type:complete
MTEQLQAKLLSLSNQTTPPRAVDIGASFLRKLAAPGDPMKKFAVLNGHMAKLNDEQRNAMIALVDVLNVVPEPAAETTPERAEAV